MCFCVRRKMFGRDQSGTARTNWHSSAPWSRLPSSSNGSGIIHPRPHMARNMWVMEQELGESLDRRELAALVKASSRPHRRLKLPKSSDPRTEGGSDAGSQEALRLSLRWCTILASPSRHGGDTLLVYQTTIAAPDGTLCRSQSRRRRYAWRRLASLVSNSCRWQE